MLSGVAEGLTDAATKVLERRGHSGELAALIERAGISIRPGELGAFVLTCSLAGLAIGFALGGPIFGLVLLVAPGVAHPDGAEVPRRPTTQEVRRSARRHPDPHLRCAQGRLRPGPGARLGRRRGPLADQGGVQPGSARDPSRTHARGGTRLDGRPHAVRGLHLGRQRRQDQRRRRRRPVEDPRSGRRHHPGPYEDPATDQRARRRGQDLGAGAVLAAARPRVLHRDVEPRPTSSRSSPPPPATSSSALPS